MRFLPFIFLLLSSTGLANEEIKVGIIDTGLDLTDERFKNVLCSEGHRDFTNKGIKDVSGHGTHITGLVKKYAQDAKFCIIIIKYFHNDANYTIKGLINSLKYANTLNLTLINLSLSGEYSNLEEKTLIKNSNSIFMIAAGNDNVDLNVDFRYPASYNLSNMFVIGAVNKNKEITEFSNYGSIVDIWELGVDVLSTYPNGKEKRLSGTSQATAIYTGKTVKRLYEKNFH